MTRRQLFGKVLAVAALFGLAGTVVWWSVLESRKLPDGTRFEAPDGKKVAIADPDNSSPDRFVIASTDRQMMSVAYQDVNSVTSDDGRRYEGLWAGYRFEGWTADSRYAVIEGYDQYGNSSAYAVDTVIWELVPVSPTARGSRSCQRGAGPNCPEGTVAFAPFSPRVLLVAGIIVDLDSWTDSYLLTDLDRDHVRTASWSPDEQYLVFVAASFFQSDDALFLAHGNGAQVRRIALIDSCGTGCSLTWALSGRSVTLQIGSTQQAFDIVEGEAVPVTHNAN